MFGPRYLAGRTGGGRRRPWTVGERVVATKLLDGVTLGRPSTRFLWWLVAIVVAGAALRLGYVWFDRRPVGLLFNDGVYYHYGANVLADGHGFVNPLAKVDLGLDLPSADHPPLYQVYLALFSLVGLDTVTDHLFAGVVLGVASIAMAGLAGRRIAGDRVGLIAAALVAVSPNVWRYDGSLMSEVAVVFLVLVIMWLSYRYWDRPSMAGLAAIGAVIGLAALARAELLLLVPLLVVPMGLLAPTVPGRRRIGQVVVGSVVCVALLVPWVAYNRVRFDEPVYISENVGSVIGGSYCETTFQGPLLGYWDFGCPARAVDAAGYSAPGDQRAAGAAQHAGVTYLRDHVGRLPVVLAARLGRVVGIYQPTQQRDLDALTEGVGSWVATAGMITLPFTLVAAAAGAVLLRRRRRVLFPLLAPVACVLVTVLVFYGATRFRATAEGPLCLLAAVALEAGWRRWGPRHSGRTLRGADGPN